MKNTHHHKRQKQRGAALIIVLLLVASLSFIVLGLSQKLSASVNRTASVAARENLLWKAVSLEVLARGALRQIQAQLTDVPRAYGLENPIFAAPLNVPLADGLATIQFTDGGRCFNINSLARSDRPAAQNPGTITGPNPAVLELTALVQALGLGETEAEKLTNVVRDWIDNDSIQEIGGAEDNFYTALPTPFRTGQTQLADISELRAMDGVTVELYEALSLFLCALPETQPTILNINMLRPQDAPLLTALTRGALDVQTAQEIITNRPPGGWANVGEFWSLPALQALELEEEFHNSRTSIETSYIAVRGQTALNEIDIDVEILFKTSRNGGIDLISREFGVEN